MRYVLQGNPRTTAISAVAKANGLELEFVHTEPAKGVSDEYKKLNKLGLVPTFEGTDGYVLSEAIAIAIYSKPYPTETYRWSCTLSGRRLRQSLYPPCPDERSISNTVIPV